MGTSIGQVQALFTADTKGFDASVKMSAEQLKVVSAAAQQAGSSIQQTGNVIDRAARLQEQSAERARRAWQREKLQQDLAMDAQKEAAHTAEMAALHADILARSVGAAGEAAAHSVPAWSAASGAIRVLEGGMNNNVRAAERFLGTTLGLGPVLMAAFPVVGAIALGGVMSELVKKVVDFSKNAAILGRETGSGWLDGAIGQVDGLAAKVKQADEEILDLGRDMGAMGERSRSLDIERIRLTQGPAAAFRAEAAQQQGYISQQQPLLGVLQTERAQIMQRLQQADIRRSLVGGGEVSMSDQYHMGSQDILAARTRLSVLDVQIRDINAHVQNAQKEIVNLNLQAKQADQTDEQRRAAAAGTQARENAAAARRLAQENSQRWAFLAGHRNAQFTEAARDQQRFLRSVGPEPRAAFDFGRGDLIAGPPGAGGPTPGVLAAQARAREIVADNVRAFNEERDKIAVATGAMTAHSAAIRKLSADSEDYREKLLALTGQVSALRQNDAFYAQFGLPNPNAQREQEITNQQLELQGRASILRLQDQALIDSTSALGQFKRALIDNANRMANGPAALAGFAISTLDSVNETFIKTLSTPASMMRGRYPWRNLGASVAQNASMTALRYGEGTLMKASGLAKPDGTQGNPLWVKLAGGFAPGGAANASAAASLISSFTGSNGSSVGNATQSVVSGIGSVLMGLPHFAGGGSIPSNLPAIVGENEPEVFIPSTAGRIVPNSQLGGVTQHIYVDARGSDSAGVTAAVHRTMAGYLPHLARTAQSSIMDHNRRVPSRGRI